MRYRKDVLLRAYRGSSTKNLSLVAGGVTYYVLIALFPDLAALISLYGLVANPHQIETEVGAMSGLMVPSAQKPISDELHQLVSVSSGALGVGAVIGILVALYSASRGMAGMISALGIAYDQEERRGFLRFNLIAIVLTLVMLIAGSVAIALVAVLLAALQTAGGAFKWVPLVGEWPLLTVFIRTATRRAAVGVDLTRRDHRDGAVDRRLPAVHRLRCAFRHLQ